MRTSPWFVDSLPSICIMKTPPSTGIHLRGCVSVTRSFWCTFLITLMTNKHTHLAGSRWFNLHTRARSYSHRTLHSPVINRRKIIYLFNTDYSIILVSSKANFSEIKFFSIHFVYYYLINFKQTHSYLIVHIYAYYVFHVVFGSHFI